VSSDTNNSKVLEDSFTQAQTVILTTYGVNGEKHERPMVNLNKSPYNAMDFTTYKNTRKVDDIKNNPEVSIKFPGIDQGEYFEIYGKAEFEPDTIVQEKWEFWYNEVHPWSKAYFWFPRFIHHSNWTIIRIIPSYVKKIEKTPA
jgi:general stress protein 26